MFVIIFISAFIGCNKEHNDAPPLPPSKSFQYKAFDTSGILLVSGWFTVDITDSAHVSGDWHFQLVGNMQNTGPQYGDGELSGSFNEGSLWINLNPRYVDNNVLLRGEYTTNNYNGTWSWSGFPGILNRSSFQAVKD